jgi:hypothetical protein
MSARELDFRLRQQLREDAAELAGVLIDLLDRAVISGLHERDRIGRLPALRRGAELGEKMREAEGRAHDCPSCRRGARMAAAGEAERSWTDPARAGQEG